MKKRLVKRRLALPLPKTSLTPEEIREAERENSMREEYKLLEELERGRLMYVEREW